MKRRHISWQIAAALLLGLFFASGCGGNATLPNDADALVSETFAAETLGDWQIEGDAAGRTAVVDEMLLIEIDQPNTMQFTTLTAPTLTDFVLEVDARLLAGDTQTSFGVLFRMQSPQEFYRFEITGSGMYILERRNADGTWSRFVEDWTDAEAINRGLNAPNRLKVEAVGRNMSVYVNDVLLHQASDNSYTGGMIALDAGTFTQPAARIAFDNLIIRVP